MPNFITLYGEYQRVRLLFGEHANEEGAVLASMIENGISYEVLLDSGQMIIVPHDVLLGLDTKDAGLVATDPNGPVIPGDLYANVRQ